MIRIQLAKIRDNPFQSRTEYFIKDLAESIIKMSTARSDTAGLLQVPPARIVLDGEPVLLEDDEAPTFLVENPTAKVQLAAGHRRLRAFHYLQQRGGVDWFPVSIQFLTDEQMSDIAWSENHDREDISPIEQAEAIRLAMDKFNWTQKQIGERWGLSQSAVANKLRLLKLPRDAKNAIRQRRITERHGRLLLKAAAYSPEVYDAVAQRVITAPVSTTLLEKVTRLYNTHSKRYIETRKTKQKCTACDTPLGDIAPISYESVSSSRDDPLILCRDCFQAARGRTAPTVEQTGDIVTMCLNQNSTPIFKSDLDVTRHITHPEVVDDLCTRCDFFIAGTNETADRCLHPSCLPIKKEAFFKSLCVQIRQQMSRDNIKIVQDIGNGHGLYDYYECDITLAANKCRDCAHFQLIYYPHGNHQIRVVDGMNFFFHCDDYREYRRCVNELSGKSEPEPQPETDSREQIELIEAAARATHRATNHIAAKLKNRNPQLWSYFAYRITDSTEQGMSYDHSVQIIARALLNIDQGDIENHPDFIIGKIGSMLSSMSIPLPPTAADLSEKLTRIETFLDTTTDLTPEMITGNLTNLEKIKLEICTSELSDQDIATLLAKVHDIIKKLNQTISQEIPAPATA